jgi:hypothetical protein
MNTQRTSAHPGSRTCDPDRLRHLHLVAAARATAVQPTSERQVADIVRVTVDDEVDTSTFRAIVVDVSKDVLG